MGVIKNTGGGGGGNRIDPSISVNSTNYAGKIDGFYMSAKIVDLI